jgi:CIC family chloride channel protein
MEAIALRRGHIRPRVAIAKIIASAITIGAGGSAGREGPIVQVGSALGSTIGQLAKLSDDQIRMLVASGAAAGIAATFNAPIAGCMFALEVILGRFSNRYLGIVVVAAVSANVVSRSLLGDAPAFHVPVYQLNSSLELPLYALMALLCTLAAIGFIRALYAAEHLFDSWKVPLHIRTATGMGLTGIAALFAPEVLGTGLEFIGETIADDITISIGFMVILLVLKLFATTFTLGAGNSGGVFAPALFMGQCLAVLSGNWVINSGLKQCFHPVHLP